MRCSHLIFLKKFQKLQLSKRVNTKSNLLLHKMMRIFPFPPRIKFTYPYHNYYGSSFYRFMQLELLICTSTSIFKHFLYTNMPYICNAKIGCNFITLSFQHTQLQHFCPEIPQQRAGYSTSVTRILATQREFYKAPPDPQRNAEQTLT